MREKFHDGRAAKSEQYEVRGQSPFDTFIFDFHVRMSKKPGQLQPSLLSGAKLMFFWSAVNGGAVKRIPPGVAGGML